MPLKVKDTALRALSCGKTERKEVTKVLKKQDPQMLHDCLLRESSRRSTGGLPEMTELHKNCDDCNV